ncbi:MAG: nucleoside 2-deoxyribosyltransferase [Thermomicrobiales bacterium]|nr:nucleoside 2-deoxyribosyltransferase [Thermomicrobiales bacterium]
MKRIYLASPLGFATSTMAFMGDLVAALEPIVAVENPWDKTEFSEAILACSTIDSYAERIAKLEAINFEIGRSNTEMIDRSDAVFAVLDGVDVDSGTAAEIGYAFGTGKKVYGIRTDFRLAGDNLGSTVNLQIEYFIHASGGRIVSTVDDLVECGRELSSSLA